MKKLLQVILLGLLAHSAAARPYLQLQKSESGSPDSIALCAIVDALAPGATGTFYISAAVVPTTPEPANYVGSFTFDGKTVHATADMVFGTPPRQAAVAPYPAWYKEFSFTFNRSQRTILYDINSPDAPARPPYHDGGDAMFRDFEVDLSGLPDGATLAFNIYTYDTPRRRSFLRFIPFLRRNDQVPPGSGGQPPVQVTDEASSLLLMAPALVVLAWAVRRRSRR